MVGHNLYELGGEVSLRFQTRFILLHKYFKNVSLEFDEFRVNTHIHAALLVLVIYYVGEFFKMGAVLFFSLKKLYIYVCFVFLHYNGWCWYFCFRWGILS